MMKDRDIARALYDVRCAQIGVTVAARRGSTPAGVSYVCTFAIPRIPMTARSDCRVQVDRSAVKGTCARGYTPR